MAVITSASSGNFSAPATWVGGVVPGVSDDAVAATGHTVAIDVDVTVISVQQAGTGKFTLGNGRTLTGNVIANAGTFTSGGTVDVTATTTAVINGNVTGVSSTTNFIAGIVITGSGTLTVNGSLTGSAGNCVSGSAMIYTNVACTLNVNGAVTGGTGAIKRGITVGSSSNAAITITTTGNVTGGSGSASHAVTHDGAGSVSITATTIQASAGFGVYMSNASSTLTINAVTFQGGGTNGYGVQHDGSSAVVVINATTVQAGTGTNSWGVYLTGAFATLTITATLLQGGPSNSCWGVRHTGSSGLVAITATTVQSGLGAGAEGVTTSSPVNVVGSVIARGGNHAIACGNTGTGVIFQGDMTDQAQGTVAIYTRVFRITATNSGVTRYANTIGYPNGTLVSRVSPNNVTGMAQVGDVRKPVVYGYNNELTGTMAVPVAQSVAYGVPVDSTLGSAEFDLGRVAEIIGLQVAAGKST